MRLLGYSFLVVLLASCASRCHHDNLHEADVAAQSLAPRDPPEPIIGGIIEASRGRCTSPCAVFFDAIADWSWEQIESSRFTWAFGDGETADGFMAAHVFELSEGENEKIFETKLLVERDGFTIARDTQTITVRPPRGRTICVAKRDFSGCPSKAKVDHFTDVSAAWNAIETNGRVLFRRGDSFSPRFRLNSTVRGPVQVGAFGEPTAARPALVQASKSWRLGSGWSLTDLDVSGGGMGGALIGISGDHTLVLRSRVHDAEKAFVSNGEGYDFSTHKFIFHNEVTAIEGTNYIAGNYIAIVGNRMERHGERHHTIRIGGGKHVLVAGNSLISEVGHSSLTVRGSSKRPGSDYVLAQGNLLMQWASVHPQNTSSNESLRHVIWERNVHVPHPSQTSIRNGLSINGADIVIRNNVFDQVRRAIAIETHPLAGASHNIHVYQNTQFVDQDRDSSHSFCSVGSGATAVVVQNNLAVLHSRASSSQFVSLDADAVVARNYSYAPSRTELCTEPDGGSNCTDPKLANTSDRASPSFMMPQAGSLAIDAARDVPMSHDFHGTPRPQGGFHDIGAVERPE